MSKRPTQPKSPKQRPATGPKTRAGKAQSSQNALTHGATARKLINEGERRAYEAWVAELTTTYPSDNPLIRLQIERISQLKVQLYRIQNAISAAHEIERFKKDAWERASEVLALTEAEIAQFAWTRVGSIKKEFGVAERDASIIALAQELAAIVDLEKLTTHSAFLQ